MAWTIVASRGSLVIGIHTDLNSWLIGDDCSEVYETSPPLGSANSITLSKGGDFVTLNNPSFDNQEQTFLKLLVHTNRSGPIRVGYKSYTNQPTSFRLKCEALSTTQKEAFESFIADHQGEEISLTDHENQNYDGVIITPFEQMTKMGRGCKWSVNFEFEVTD